MEQSPAHAVSLNSKFKYDWSFKDYPKKNRFTVMSTFACGGGSSMGYKLAGFDVVAANDIDPQMAKVYKANHAPKQFFLCDIKDLLARNDLPEVDILDGSPPCSVFSIAGSRESAWQKDKMFREGQSKQILDDLFFDFVNLVEKMQPKVVVAENVKGMLIGHAKWYTREIVRRLKRLGYNCQVFLLNASTMGVPQKRERVFFIANKRNKKIKLNFNEEPITFDKIVEFKPKTKKILSKETQKYWEWCKANNHPDFAKYSEATQDKRKLFNHRLIFDYSIPDTVTASSMLTSYTEPRYLTENELIKIGSFPADYNFLGLKADYLIGMSVPPVMMAQVAHQVREQLL